MNGGEVYLGVVISGFVGVLLININISVVFCWSLVGGCHVCFDLWWGALAAGSSLGSSVGFSVGSLVGSLVGSWVGSLVGSSVGSLVSSSSLGFFGSGCRYSFIIVVLK